MRRSYSKQRLKEELVGRLAAELQTAERAQEAASEGATHEEARPEDDKDTRGLELSYLARGQARRVEELRQSLAEVRAMPLPRPVADQPVAVGALVEVEEEDQALLFFLATQGGGTALAKGQVQVLTPHSPLAVALIGKRAGDDCDVHLAGRTRTLEILRVR